MAQTATITGLPAAFRMMKAMCAPSASNGARTIARAPGRRRRAAAQPYGPAGRRAHRAHAELGQADRRNGCYRRHLLTELGDIELAVPRTRPFSALKVVRAYARRAPRTSTE